MEGATKGKHLNYTLIGRTVTRFNLYKIILESWNKNRSRNCGLNNTNITFVRALSAEKQHLVKFKRIIVSGLVELTSTVSGGLPSGGLIPDKLYCYKFLLRNTIRMCSFTL